MDWLRAYFEWLHWLDRGICLLVPGSWLFPIPHKDILQTPDRARNTTPDLFIAPL